MTPMCDVNTGEMVGWGVATVDCDGGSPTIEYIDVVGDSLGSTLPGSWASCQPRFSANSVQQIVQITQAAYDSLGSTDPNTLYVITE